MANHYTILTDVGATKVANALRSGSRIEIREMALGDGNGTLPQPDGSAKALVNERYRAQINSASVDAKNDAWVIFEQILAPDVGGWWIREVALYDTDGDLIAIGNYPEQYKPLLTEGASTTQTVRVVIQVLSSAAITLNVDPAVVLATRKDLESAVQGLEDRKASKDELNKAIEGLGVQAAARMTHSNDALASLEGSKIEVADTAQLVEARKLIDALVPAGTVIHVAMSNAPEGYLAANGSAVSRQTYARLFAAIGTTFGGGDGSTTFNLPDLRGEFIRGWDNGRGVDSGRQIGSWQAPTALRTEMGPTWPDDQGKSIGLWYSSVDNQGLSIKDSLVVDPKTPNGTSVKDNSNSSEDNSLYANSIDFTSTNASKSWVTIRPRNIALLACIKI
ncbi:phage tail protein [Zymobacter sp. IVIA_12111.31 C1]|uniref:phage tail protein n=1 Tax=Zymobacter sp. IVIA_12111.31 C1 TaxID=3394854 RepID=UPI0039C3EA16